MSIEQNLYDIIHARWGKDVRQSIHDGIEQCYTDGRAGATDLTAREAIASEVATRTNETHKQTATSTDFDLVTADGGIEVERVVGKSFKSANLATITNGSVTNHGITSSLANGVLNLSGTADSTWAQVGKSGSFNDISISSGKTVTVSINKTLDFNLILRFKTTDGSDFDIAINKGTTSTTKTLTNGVTAYYYFISGLTSGTTYSASNVSIMLNEGSTALPYIPYGIHSSGQYGCVDMSTPTWTYVSGSTPYFETTISDKAFGVTNVWCEEYATTETSAGSTSRADLTINGSSANAKVRVKDTRFTTVNDFVNHVKGTLLSYEYSSTPSQYAEVWEEQSNNICGVIEQGVLNENGVNATSSTRVRTRDYSKMTEGQKYTVSGKVGSANCRVYVYFYNEAYTKTTSIAWQTCPYTFTVPSGSKYARFIFDNNNATISPSDLINPQIEQGTTATAYTPYQHKTIIFPLAEPLCSVGDVHDYIDIENGCIVRNIKTITLNGSETYSFSGKEWVVKGLTNDVKPTATNNTMSVGLSDRFTADTPTNCYIGKTDNTFAITIKSDIERGLRGYISTVTTADEAKAYFTNNPTDFLVILATPTTQPLTADQLNALNSWKSFAGKTIITSQDLADAKPSVTLNYGKSDAMAKALEGVCEAKRVDATEPDNKAIADAYNPKTTYVAGDYFISQDCLYKVKVGCQGIQPPNSTYYELTSVGKELRGSNILKDTVDIASFKSANPYICPCEGYFQVINTSGSALGYVVSNDLTGGAITIGGAVGRFSVYVRKGMKLYNDATAATYSRFVPFK